MGLAYDIVVGGVITIICVAVHLMGVELFAPGTQLHTIASDGTAVLSGATRADQWWQMIGIYIPTAGFIGIWLWVLIRAYRRQVQTAARPG